jgi:hypothetical protein
MVLKINIIFVWWKFLTSDLSNFILYSSNKFKKALNINEAELITFFKNENCMFQFEKLKSFILSLDKNTISISVLKGRWKKVIDFCD